MTDQKAESELKTLYQITGNAADINTILINRGEFRHLRAYLERVSMQLIACGVVAMSDTPDSAKKARIMHPDYESSSLDDVKRLVDECIALRAKVAELEAQLESIGAGGVGPLMAPVKQAQQVAAQKDAVFEACIDFIGTLTGMKPPPIETAPPEIFEPFRNFTERVCSIFFAAAPEYKEQE